MSSAEGGVRRGYTPRAALGVLDADGNALYAEGIKPSASCLIPVVCAGSWRYACRRAATRGEIMVNNNLDINLN
jgi:hypothetical protein